ncbi:MAG: hypothetical protein C4292_05950, partial [Nitrososphaera sp.]
EFVADYMRRHRPKSVAEARRLMRQAAKEWGGKPNPMVEGDAADFLKAGFAGGLGLAVGLVAAAAVVCILTGERSRKGCPYC